MEYIRFVNALISDKDNNILALWRSDSHPTRPLAIDLPGGGIEKNEETEDALVREVNEELGLRVSRKDLKLLYENSQVRNNNEYLVGSLYGIEIAETKPAIVLSWEHSRYSWVRESELVGFSGFHQEAIDYVLRNTNG